MFDTPQLEAYLRRIKVPKPRRADAEALRRIHRGHLTTIPYETLDIQLGRKVSLDPQALFEKIVESRRGGFCYELNWTFALALRAAGFEVTLVEGGVHREKRGDSAWGNHLVLLVEADGRRWIADGGLANGFIEPVPLEEGTARQGPFTHRLERLDSETWRCFPDPHGSVSSFDIRVSPQRIEDFEARCLELSTSPESSFVRVLSVYLPGEPRMSRLVSRTFASSGPDLPDGKTERLVPDREQFASILFDHFRLGPQTLGPAEVDRLWDKATAQHEVWLSQKAA
ncbi:arylamine N-acetyltransferase family protein [Stackebrandtia nassauensis]|uniref:N-acetyltransferase n=1 Tax=Stackebrandtia nassauensis (strain DSM 44728 / CIP 108903 / NRRL B-16338 / NBRC 102104 / LLR-40K-21) TaxID=446470 RepID=D3Q106_STANL|nr:arylamine N-acetyltransferase [Stackebrandtia nassauensis]ADD43756.1 N-acetyltransferase [Stackebrandtia nassauensis DSM 44728]